jgi:hypothetical protein
MRFRTLLAALLLALWPSFARAQNQSASLVSQGMFPFVLPWDDATKSATDVSFLNSRPAGAGGFLRAQGEQFVDESGRVVKLWGVNLNFAGVFPDKTQAPKIAARLSKFGFNAVRFHHFDGLPSPGGIWKANSAGKLLWPNEIDPAQLDRLDFFASELMKRGIYLDFNLHVARKVTERDGFLDASKLPDKDKGIPYFDDRLAQRNRDFARQLLSHVNPYTTRAYKDEPGVCAIEVDNESSLLQMWLDGKLDNLPPTYAEAIRSGWNDWTRQKYHNDGTLQRAWTELNQPLGAAELLLPALGAAPPVPPTPTPNLDSLTVVPPPTADELGGPKAPTLSGWNLVLSGGARGQVARDDLGGPAVDGVVQPGLSVRLDAAGSVSWGFQLVHDDLPLESGKVYTLSFAARATNGRSISLNAWDTRRPFRWLGVKQVVRLRDDWAFYQLSFRPSGAKSGFVRLAFDVGNSPGLVQIGALSLKSGGRIGAPTAWSVRGNLPLIDAQNEPIFPVRRDFARYLGALELRHTLEWRRFLKDDLKVRVPIWQTQAQFGGWGGAQREMNSDAMDVHIYWKHPEFSGAAWDLSGWHVGNVSMATSPQNDPLVSYSLVRATNKPLVVTEWNSGQPNDYGAETLLMAASHAAHQGWAGVWLFDYHSNGAWDRNGIENFFSIDSNTAKMATAPLAALLFRRGDVTPSNTLTYLALPPDAAWSEVANTPVGPSVQPFLKTWTNAGASRDIGLTSRAQTVGARAMFPTPSLASLESPSSWTSDTGEVRHDARGWSVDAPKSKAFAGLVAGRRFKMGELEMWFPASTIPWAAGGLTSLDAEPIETSKRMLLTLVGRAENPNMGWNAARDSVGSNWGQGPLYVSSPSGTVKLWTSFKSARVWALDERGERRFPVPSTVENGALKFSPSNLWRTVWYEVELS